MTDDIGDGSPLLVEDDDPDECIPLTPEQDAAMTVLWQSVLAKSSPAVQRYFARGRRQPEVPRR